MDQTTVHDADPHGFATGPHSWQSAPDRGHRYCSYCGSVHPADLAVVLRAGYGLDPADRKYGWPHKYYLSGPGEWGKFYTLHLQDAALADRQVIEQKMGLNFNFAGNNVSWTPYTPE